MARTRFQPDRGLTSRMVLVMFLLGLLYVAAVGGLIAAGLNFAWVIIIAGGFLLAQWFFSDKIALAAMGAREVSPDEAPELHAVIDRLCALADMPKPRVAIADTDMPNAFATGRNPNKAVLCVTTGIMRRLTRTELEGVLAHELSHVAHRDVAVMTIASFLGVLAGLVARFGMYSGMGRGSRDNNAAMVFAVVWLTSIAVYVISFLLTRALSRYREFAADRAGAYLTGNPSELASALTKISGDIAQIPTRDLRRSQPAQAFFFAPAAVGKSLGKLLSTHPTTEQRLARLAQVSAELGKPML
ncbi:heat shock protein HtpX [Actinopolymorpha cephalotaxi]|uniref:Protease HtpX homolog n=1 Tax=Actinopolymorpha cephalotaxi TaxID=504797 RepID=A0A1I2QNM5_9ACTN|nr:zinc metalloprotease HtpX [Actinopolymorpha cephalotaxi]NYH82572.1 heat shock protein HtpX [Actinopolymorpha cephalotaxi]SFG29580.1 heat shock protein HtpX [Actinopolymorpha cephalotaxi]